MKKTVVLITHNAAISQVGNRVAMIGDGAIRSIRTNEQPVPVEQVKW
jgi:putative ABC transport system ATP-binding protein